ncbi:unnamed protein product, partial [Tetraodon nigroviridis]
KVFLTYSSDCASEVGRLIDFLTWHGFQAAIDIFDGPISCMDKHLMDVSSYCYLTWEDRNCRFCYYCFNQPSTLIIIAISPKYKEDVEGAGLDANSLRTKYIYTTMQNQFIHQGSLNFRFIPVCFPNASQKHVPGWLQNTHVYQWPEEMEDLLLGLRRMEKYSPPP